MKLLRPRSPVAARENYYLALAAFKADCRAMARGRPRRTTSIEVFFG